MPLIQVKLFENELSDEVMPDLIEKLTDALCAATREELRPATWVIVEGVPAENWGIGGGPSGR
jgi:4-oxalocrotonate tautomerase